MGPADLHVTQAWQTTDGAGVTVAGLGTGVAAGHRAPAGSVSYRAGLHRVRAERAPFLGIDGTEVAEIIAGTGTAPAATGLLGIAPGDPVDPGRPRDIPTR